MFTTKPRDKNAPQSSMTPASQRPSLPFVSPSASAMQSRIPPDNPAPPTQDQPSRNLDPMDPDFDMEYVFGTGQICVEARLTASDLLQPVTVAPIQYANNLREKIASTKKYMTASDQRDYLEQQVERKSQYHTLTSKLDPDRANISDAIASVVRMSSTKTYNVGGKTYYYPRVPTNQQAFFIDAVTHYIDRLYASIDAAHRTSRNTIDIPATSERIQKTIRIPHDMTPDEKTCVMLLQHATTLEWIRDMEESKAIAYLRTRPLLDVSANGYAFVTSNVIPTTPSITSLIPPDAADIATTPLYNFSSLQLHNLINAIFQRDPRNKLLARIQLLSSTRNDIRSDIVVNPGATLKRALAEHYCTRHEILLLIFNMYERGQPTDTYKCPWCALHVSIQPSKLVHPRCCVTDWLVENYQYTQVDDGLRIPSGYLMDCTASTYATELVSLDAQHRLRPIVSRTADELSVWAVSDTGDPRKVLSHGVRTVRHVNPSDR